MLQKNENPLHAVSHNLFLFYRQNKSAGEAAQHLRSLVSKLASLLSSSSSTLLPSSREIDSNSDPNIVSDKIAEAAARQSALVACSDEENGCSSQKKTSCDSPVVKSEIARGSAAVAAVPSSHQSSSSVSCPGVPKSSEASQGKVECMMCRVPVSR